MGKPSSSKIPANASKQRWVKESKHSSWSTQDKKALLSAMREHGWKNFELIAGEIKTKTPAEVKQFIRVKLNVSKKFTTMVHDNEKTPIELWIERVNKLVRQMPDYSKGITQVLSAIAADEEFSDVSKLGQPNYQQLYKFLEKLLDGEPPPDLPVKEGLVILRMINLLSEVLKLTPLHEEWKTLIESAERNESSSQTNSAGSNATDSSQPSGSDEISVDPDYEAAILAAFSGDYQDELSEEFVSVNPIPISPEMLIAVQEKLQEAALYQSCMNLTDDTS